MTESRWLKHVEQRTFSTCLPQNPSQRTPPGDRTVSALPPELPPTSTAWPPFLPSGLQTPLKGGVRTAGREIGVWRDDYLHFHLFSLASMFSPARGGQGSPVTSGAIVTPHYSAPLSPPTGPLAACVVMETGRQQSSSGLREN